MNQETKYQLYKVETSGKHYVRYGDGKEREITASEYAILQQEKDRLLAAKIDKKETHDQKPKMEEIKRCNYYLLPEMVIYKHPKFDDVNIYAFENVQGNFIEGDEYIILPALPVKEIWDRDVFNTISQFIEYGKETNKECITFSGTTQKMHDYLKKMFKTMRIIWVDRTTIILMLKNE